MAPHIIDLPVWALELGYPTMISSAGGRYILDDDGDAYDHHEVLWQYPKLTMTWMSSLTNSYDFLMKSQPPERRLGIYFHGSNGTLYSNYGMFRVLAEGDRMKDKESPPASIPSSPGHEREWLDCIKTAAATELRRCLPCARRCADRPKSALAETRARHPVRPRHGKDRRRPRSRATGGAGVPAAVEVPEGILEELSQR